MNSELTAKMETCFVEITKLQKEVEKLQRGMKRNTHSATATATATATGGGKQETYYPSVNSVTATVKPHSLKKK